MITTLTVGVSGSGELTSELVEDTLNDLLAARNSEARLLVPTTVKRLSGGVQRVVEWAWGHDAEVVAVLDCTSTGTLVEQFLDDGPQEVIEGTTINEAMVEALVAARPNAVLVVVSEEDADPETLALIQDCLEAGVPAQDLSLGLLEIDQIANPDPADLDAPDSAEDPDVTFESQPAATESNGDGVMNDCEDKYTGTGEGLNSIEDILSDPVRAVRIAKALLNLKQLLEDVEVPPPPTPPKRDHRTRREVSFDNGKTWQPRGRGRIPAHAIVRTVEK